MSTPHQPPRKVTLATVLHSFSGPWPGVAARATELGTDLETARQVAKGKRLDLVVFPEGVLTTGRAGMPASVALPLAGEVEEAVAQLACAAQAYLVVPFLLREPDGAVSNAAVLVGRTGAVVGIYRKAHPVAALGETQLEGGVRPGREFPVFDCDFGRLGIQICWDMSYDDGWAELARQGAELIAVPSASPQTLRPAAYALRHRTYVVTSTPRDNVSVFNPAGMTEARRTEPGVLVHTIDLSHAVLHWSERLEDGRVLTRRYGDRVGYVYSQREDTGVFWSNDPGLPIGGMLHEAGLETMDEQAVRCERLRSHPGKNGLPDFPISK
jgi:predicted amidohydrolase